MSKTTVTLPFKKETKNALQYQAEDRTMCTLPTLYVMKAAFPDCPDKKPWPDQIEVIVQGIWK